MVIGIFWFISAILRSSQIDEVVKAYGDNLHHWSIALMAKMAKSDGPITKQEIECVDEYIKAVPVEAGRRIFNQAKDDFITDKQIILRMLKFLDERQMGPKGMQSTYLALLNLALSDGPLVIQERDFLLYLLLLSNFDQATIAAARTNLDQLLLSSRAADKPNGHLDECYSDLGLSSGATQEEVQKKFRELVKDFHPDKVSGLGLNPEFTKFASDRFKKIKSSYDKIMSHLKK
jgi:DnaJ like chaperone protein